MARSAAMRSSLSAVLRFSAIPAIGFLTTARG